MIKSYVSLLNFLEIKSNTIYRTIVYISKYENVDNFNVPSILDHFSGQ